MSKPRWPSIQDALLLMQQGGLSPQELLDGCLKQIDELNPRLNAFITVIRPDGQGDREHGTADTQALESIPIAVKDLFDTAGVRTTGGARFFQDNVPAVDAEAVRRLKVSGAEIVGKTNTHEVALGVTTVNPHFGACRNPWDESRIPGGSSGGSAVAVATGMALGALGTDTGGSIRIPASLCGIVGLKPTYGRVSVRGVLPLSWNLDHVGPLARTVTDAAILLAAIAGYDAADPFCADAAVDEYPKGLNAGIRGWRIALGRGDYVEGADGQVLAAVENGAKALEAAGAKVVPLDVSFLKDAALANGMMTQADGAAFHRERLAQHPEWFGDDVRRRLEAGRDLPVSDYILARKTQSEMKRRLTQILDEFDVLVLPTTPITAPRIEGEDAVEQAKRLTRFTAPFNLTGLPALSVPCGLSREGLPVGMQMVCGAWLEARLLQAGAAYERASGVRDLCPPI